MITRQPRIGDKIEYLKGWNNWISAGEIVGVVGNIAYTRDPNSLVTHDEYFVNTPVSSRCESANNGFIWKFHDGLNKLHRIVE